MKNNNYFDLPELLELNDFGGDFQLFFDAVYREFKKDFITNKLVFRGCRLGLKKHPLVNDKEATFWHMISEGEVESERIPDISRMERIKWPARLINESEHPYLRVWENTRGRKSNILIFHEGESYLVVLRRGNGYLIPWTAYIIEHAARKHKLMNEYHDYIKAKPAQH